MAYTNIRTIRKRFVPAAVGTGETTALFSVAAGERVLWCSVRKEVLAATTTDSTITIGDGDDADGYVAAIDTEAGAVGDLIDGGGAYLAESGGKLYTAEDTVDAVYAEGTTPGATAPQVNVLVAIAREWP